MSFFRTAGLIVTMCLALACAYPAGAQQTGKVQISSLNLKGEILPFIGVVIEGEAVRRELRTVGIGREYKDGGLVELPVGTYRITSLNGNYYPFRRASFRVRAGATIKINVLPAVRVLEQVLVIDDQGSRDEYEFAPPPKYSAFRLPGRSGGPSDLIIRYDRKRPRGEAVEYTGSRTVGGAMASHDALAIYAGRFRFNVRKLLLEAEGGVILEDGSGRAHLNKVAVSFRNGAPRIIRR